MVITLDRTSVSQACAYPIGFVFYDDDSRTLLEKKINTWCGTFRGPHFYNQEAHNTTAINSEDVSLEETDVSLCPDDNRNRFEGGQ